MAFGIQPADVPPPVSQAFGESGGTPALVVDLLQDGEGQLNEDCFAWLGTVLVSSEDASWSDADGITFATAGIYEICMDGYVDRSMSVDPPLGMMRYGGAITSDFGPNINRGQNWFTVLPDSPWANGIKGQRYSDRFTFQAAAAESLMPSAYAAIYTVFGPVVHSMQLTVRKLGDAA